MRTYKTEQGKALEVPENWNDINVRQLVQLQDIKGDNVAAQNKVIQILCGVTDDELSFSDFMWLSIALSEALSSPKSDKFQKNVVMKDAEGLDIVFEAKDIKDFSTREFIDFDTLAGEGKNANIPLLLAIIYSKGVEGDYEEKMRQNAKIMENMPADTALAAITFFSKALLQYVSTIVGSSEEARQMMEKNPELKNQMTKIKAFLDGAGN